MKLLHTLILVSFALMLSTLASAQTMEFRATQGRDGLAQAHMHGFNADVATSEETIWDQGGLYTYPSAAGQWKVSSSRVEDIDSATGAATVKITGLDSSYEEISETVTLNGQNAVITTNSYLRINQYEVLTAGSGGFNAGDVYLGTGTVTNGVPATKYAMITAQMNHALAAVYTVPANKWFYLTSLIATTFGNASQSLTIRLVVRPEGGVFRTHSKFLMFRSPISMAHDVPMRFEPKSDIEVRATASSGTIDASVEFGGILMGR